MDQQIFQTLPKHTCSWLKGELTCYKYQDFWTVQKWLDGAILAQQTFKAEPSDVFLCGTHATGTASLKALAFAIVTREKHAGSSTSPLLTTFLHDCVPLLERNLDKIENNHKNSSFPLVATHLPYTSLPESAVASKCKIVYIHGNVEDAILSNYHFAREALKLRVEDASFEKAFDEFCEGISFNGPYWDHILGYWKASTERPGDILFLKYEDLKRDPTGYVKRLAEFIGYPFSVEEVKAGVVDDIIKMCSLEHLGSLDVNQSGKCRPEGNQSGAEKRLFFRKHEDGYFTNEMKLKIHKLMDQKLSGTGLVVTK
ncbi:hypothetical protein R6Q59_015973 [Mikania micrantha]